MVQGPQAIEEMVGRLIAMTAELLSAKPPLTHEVLDQSKTSKNDGFSILASKS